MSAVAACQAILQRDLRAVLRSRSQLYSSILFPLMILAILGTGVSQGLDPTLVRDGDYASFLVPGAIAMAVLAVAAAVPGIDLEWQYGVAPGVLLAGAAVVLLALLLNGFAQIVASRIRTMQGFHLVMNLVLFPLLFFSGGFFPLDDLPAWLEVLATANPLSYAVDLLRAAVYADSSTHFGLPIDFAVLGALAVALFAWGLQRHPGYE